MPGGYRQLDTIAGRQHVLKAYSTSLEDLRRVGGLNEPPLVLKGEDKDRIELTYDGKKVSVRADTLWLEVNKLGGYYQVCTAVAFHCTNCLAAALACMQCMGKSHITEQRPFIAILGTQY